MGFMDFEHTWEKRRKMEESRLKYASEEYEKEALLKVLIIFACCMTVFFIGLGLVITFLKGFYIEDWELIGLAECGLIYGCIYVYYTTF